MPRARRFRVNRSSVALVAMLALGSAAATRAMADLLVYEPFDYPVGDQLVGKNGGSGFTGAWRDDAFPASSIIQSGSISYPGLPTTGNSVLMTGANGSEQVYRNFTNITGADGQTTWISFLGQRQGDAQDPPATATNPYPRGVNVSFYNTEGFAIHGREQFAVGNSSGATTNDWAFIGHGQVANILASTNPAVPFGGGPPAYIVIRIDHHGVPDIDGAGNNDDVYFFVNPDPKAEPPTEAANSKRLGTEANSFDYSGLDYIRPFVGNLNGTQPFGVMLMDELRIGTTYADVSAGGVALLAGDTDGDGIAGEYPDDLVPIRDNFQTAKVDRTSGDLVNDDFIDFLDYRQWKTAFTAGGGSLANVDLGFLTVPEPATCLLGLVGCGALSRRRRRSRLEPGAL